MAGATSHLNLEIIVEEVNEDEGRAACLVLSRWKGASVFPFKIGEQSHQMITSSRKKTGIRDSVGEFQRPMYLERACNQSDKQTNKNPNMHYQILLSGISGKNQCVLIFSSGNFYLSGGGGVEGELFF